MGLVVEVVVLDGEVCIREEVVVLGELRVGIENVEMEVGVSERENEVGFVEVRWLLEEVLVEDRWVLGSEL